MEPLRLTIRKSAIDRKERALEISAEAISFDGASMRWSDVQDIRFGSVSMQVAGHDKDVVKMNELAVRDGTGKKLTFMFQAGFTKKGRDEVTNQFEQIIDAIERAFLDAHVAATRQRIARGEPVVFGKARIENGAFHVRKGLIFKKDVSVPLTELTTRIENGDLVIVSTATKKPIKFFPLISSWNTVVVARALA